MAQVHAGVDGRIGPNAILQTFDELVATIGPTRAEALLHAATGRTAATLPLRMVDEAEVNAFAQHVLHDLGPLGHGILREAGHRTARYLLAHRIPKPAQLVIRALPPRAGLALLLSAIGRHSWTFAGSGDFAYRMDDTPWVRVIRCPMCRGLHAMAPTCDFYAGTFEGLMRALIARSAHVVETECEATGGSSCRFELRWGRPLTGVPALAFA
jgi:divinyl protochlorophyllide a 8-vinyl-reductase